VSRRELTIAQYSLATAPPLDDAVDERVASSTAAWFASVAGYGGEAELPREDASIHGAFAARATAQPHAPAVLQCARDGRGGAAQQVFTFGELLAAATSLAAEISRLSDDASGGVCCVLLDSSPARLVAYLAVLQCGLAYAPLEQSQTPEVVRDCLCAASPVALLTTRALAARLGGAASLPCPTFFLEEDCGSVCGHRSCKKLPRTTPAPPLAHALAHVCFTSGTSTGTPRMLACGHWGSLASHWWRTSLAPYAPSDVTACNVFGIWDAAAALLAGTAVLPLSDATVRDGSALGRALLRGAVTRLMLTPTLSAALLLDPCGCAALQALRVLTLCGEPASRTLLASLRRALAPHATLINLYSLSETHDVSAERIPHDYDADGDDVSVGFLAPHVSVHVMHTDGRPARPGEHGRLLIVGPALAVGQLSEGGRVDALGPGFTTLGSVRAFDTGDQGCLRKDGRLVVTGRCAGASKLKLRGGATVDAEAVEAAILAACAPRVAAAAACVRGGTLVAFLVARDIGDGLMSGPEVRAAMEGQLVARHALPSRVAWLTSLPLGPTGKLHRMALPDECEEAEASEAQAAPAASHAHGGGEDACLQRARRMFDIAGGAVGAAPSSSLRPLHTHWVLDLGGTSVSAAAMLGAANAEEEGTEGEGMHAAFAPLQLGDFLACPTLSALAHMLRCRPLHAAAAAAARARSLAEALAARTDATMLPVTAHTLTRDGHRDAVLLTGATGAIGAHILSALLGHPGLAKTRIICLVRADSDAAAAQRLARPATETRVDARASDLTAPYLGLCGGAASLAALAGCTRAVIHAAGGRVTMAASYDQLRGSHVLAVAAVLRFAFSAGAHVHLLSSSAALHPPGPCAATPPGDAPPPDGGGYACTKWAAEVLAQRFARSHPSGGPACHVTLHRVGYVAGGRHAPPDAQAIVLAACAHLCCAPDAPGWTLEWACVRKLGLALASHALHSRDDVTAPAGVRIIHYGGTALPFPDVLSEMHEAHGFRTRLVPQRAWLAAVRGGAAAGEGEALQTAAALLAAVGLDAALGGADARLLADEDAGGEQACLLRSALQACGEWPTCT